MLKSHKLISDAGSIYKLILVSIVCYDLLKSILLTQLRNYVLHKFSSAVYGRNAPLIWMLNFFNNNLQIDTSDALYFRLGES